MNSVYISACDNYKKEYVQSVLSELVDRTLSVCPIDFKGKNVLIKPNLLARREPEVGITTNPAVISAAARYFIEKGAFVTIADSPGGAYTRQHLNAVYNVTGMADAAKETGAKLNFDLDYVKRPFPEGVASKSFNIIKPAAEADYIVNICRLKTHALCEMSAAVKNMFGTIPGFQKAEQHARFPQRLDFANMLVDLCLLNSPVINIVDAVTTMEGNGPAGGTLKKVGALMCSRNPFYLDVVCAYMMGYKTNEVGSVACAFKRGLCPDSVEKVNIVGENPKNYTYEYKRPDGTAGGILRQMPTFCGGIINKLLEPRPFVMQKKCIGCGECKRCCPADTIELVNQKAHIKKEACIKCYCCQEMCPENAIEVKRNIFMRL